MPINPIYTFEYIGTNGRKTTVRYQGVEIDGPDAAGELVAAQAALEALRTGINGVTDANINDYYFSVQGSGAVGGLPADADVFNEAVLSLDITPAGQETKLASTRIPAASAGVFLDTTGPNRDVVDVNDIDLGVFVTALENHVLVSDGEAINGLVSGWRRAKGGRTS